MSGIYIKGMEMPKEGSAFAIAIHPDGTITSWTGREMPQYDAVPIPAADLRPVVRGKWNRTDAYPHRLYCSVCFKTYLKNDELLERWEFPLNFCPNCGADMRGEQDV